MNHITFEKLDELVVFAINQQLKQIKDEWSVLEQEYSRMKGDNKSKIIQLETKISRNREYQKKAYEQFMDDILEKSDYLELKQIYEKENEQYRKELLALKEVESEKKKTLDEMMQLPGKFGERKITEKQLTREVLAELIDKIYIYPEQQMDIYFNFQNSEKRT